MAFRGEAVMTLVASVSEILTLEQTSVFLQKVAERREEMRARVDSRREKRRARIGSHIDRSGVRHGRGPLGDLGLNDEQREAAHSARATLQTGVRMLMEEVRTENTSIEDALLQASELARSFETAVSELLTADQIATIEERKADQLDRHVSRRLEDLDEAMERRVVLLNKVLHLEDEQVATVSDLVFSTVPARRELLDRLLGGDVDRAVVGLEVLRVERALCASLAEVLRPDQRDVLDGMSRWLPGPPPHR
jgi:hypothetical protein